MPEASVPKTSRANAGMSVEYGLTEADSFGFVQKTAMNERRSMRSVAEEVVSGQLTPPA